ncbi:MAG: cytochrome b/b6 domain-containing protein [Sedimentisphaerales bacterium]|nr:cytochrome b/b6 domain-containing protein [Sedimentisphaerales bacterium]
MFRTISITCLLITFGGILIHWIIYRPKGNELFGADRRLRILDPLRCLVFLFTSLFIPQKLSLADAFRKLVHLLALLCFAILFITGFYSKIIHGTTISGYWLMVHATAAPVFAVCVAILACFWANNCRLNKNYWPWLQRILQREAINKEVPQKHELAQKICFWLIIVLTLPLILSIILSMFPFFGTYWQGFLADTHRYAAVFFSLAVIVHTYLLILIYAKGPRFAGTKKMT